MVVFASQTIPLGASELSTDSAKTSTTTKIKASASTINHAAKITLTVTVAPAQATGKVTFYGRQAPTKPFQIIGSSTLSSGQAKLSGHIGIKGTIGFKAVYGGNAKYAGSTSPIITVTST